MNNWSESTRDDLKNIPLAESLGWKVDFNHKDVMYHRTTPENVPMECVSFIKGEIHTWKYYKQTSKSLLGFWQVADLINGKYCNHRPVSSLEEVFKKY